MTPLSVWKVALRSTRFYSLSHSAIALGIAAATAVIVGALVVGDSVRNSLRDIALERLANVDCLLPSRNFFDPSLIESLAGSSQEATGDISAVPIVLLASTTVEKRSESEVTRAHQVQILGVDDSFWDRVKSSRGLSVDARLAANEIAINRSLAQELDAKQGDELTLRFGSASGVPADNPLGNRDDTSVNLPRQKIVAILDDAGVGGISFATSQVLPRNVFCSQATLQDSLEIGSKVNAALVLNARIASTASSPPTNYDEWNRKLQPSIADYGLKFERITRKFPSESIGEKSSTDAASDSHAIYDYYQLTSDELLIDHEAATAISQSFGDRAHHLMTYLANTIAKVQPLDHGAARSSSGELEENFSPELRSDEVAPAIGRYVPYSTVVGIEDYPGLELESYQTIMPDELRTPYCWVNSWLAEQLDAEAGDWIQLKFFEPETIDGQEQERWMRFMIAGIVPITTPQQGFRRDQAARYTTAPTAFNDPNLTPVVPGLTDKDSISSWDAPFKLDLDLIKPADDDYYSDFRLTPKMILPYHFAASPMLFGSRFGQTTAFRFLPTDFPDESQLIANIQHSLSVTRASRGYRFVPIRQSVLQSASGTTPFDMLFLSLSFFVIVAALMLVGLLFKLGIGQRAYQLGLLASQGFSRGRIVSLLLRELAIVAGAGCGLGIVLGLGFARAMIAALQSWWIGAISTPFLRFSFSWQSLLIGAFAGFIMSLLTIYLALRRLGRLPPLSLLTGATEPSLRTSQQWNRGLLATAAVLAMGALALMISGIWQTGMARAGSFFGSGMLLLVAADLGAHQMLSMGGKLSQRKPQQTNLLTLAQRAIYRNPLRSTLALSLLSVASFLIASMSVFRVSPDPRGYGSFDMLGESSQPIYRNIGSSSVRSELLGADAEQLKNVSILPLRMRPGQDASCNNLFQVVQPTVLGVPPRLSSLNDFQSSSTRFSWSAAKDLKNPWSALETWATGSALSPIPVILDQNTAAWSLKQGASLGATIAVPHGDETVFFQTVGLLSNSVLQGKLLIGEKNFQRLYPNISGYNYFLIRTQFPDLAAEQNSSKEIAAALEKGWSNEGLDITSSRDTLQRMLGVQNTYLSAFQSLGALGLLLGAFGLIAVQLRSVFERRHELALMQAVGFPKSRLTWMLTIETAILLGGGLLVGVLAAAVALVPYIIENGTQFSVLGPLWMLAAVLLIGFLAAVIAVRAAMKKSVLEGLRCE